MLKRAIKKIWSILPQSVRAGVVRSTQSKFTVSAAAVIVNEHGEVLLLNHVLRPDSGWGFPGGFIDHGEQADAAIRREIREEVGIELENVKVIRIRTFKTHIEVLFSATPIGEPSVCSPEIIELGWFKPDAVPEEMSGSQKATILEVLGLEL